MWNAWSRLEGEPGEGHIAKKGGGGEEFLYAWKQPGGQSPAVKDKKVVQGKTLSYFKRGGDCRERKRGFLVRRRK